MPVQYFFRPACRKPHLNRLFSFRTLKSITFRSSAEFICLKCRTDWKVSLNASSSNTVPFMRFELIVTLLYFSACDVFLKRYFASSRACVLYLCTHHVLHWDVSALQSKCCRKPSCFVHSLPYQPDVPATGLFKNEILHRSSLTRTCRGQLNLEGMLDASNLWQSPSSSIQNDKHDMPTLLIPYFSVLLLSTQLLADLAKGGGNHIFGWIIFTTLRFTTIHIPWDATEVFSFCFSILWWTVSMF